ncbi:MAG: tetraether lipid synthase Tes, partial [Candidatus Aenigmatarchaeota archaeon]
MAEKAPEELIKRTQSLCPDCKLIIAAEVFSRDGKVWIRKKCPKHGRFEEIYWGDLEMYRKAERFAQDGKGLENPTVKKEHPVCPLDCGLCNMHKSHTALGNIAVTNRCNLACWYCFFLAEKQGYVYEPTLGQIREMVSKLRGERPVPSNACQLTGGEPCLRPDLLEIIKICREEGIEHVQLNTNGIHLSQDVEFAKKVREAGVNTIYLSFDGISPKTNPKNHWEIPGVLRNCREAQMGIVLVPTVIKDVNEHEVGDILRFGFKNIDVVRSVNYQPVSLVGKMPRKDREKHRITIPDLIKELEAQTEGQITRDDFYPVPTVTPITRFVEALTGRPHYQLSAHFACGMGTYVFEINEKIVPITQFVDIEGLLEYIDQNAEAIEAGSNKYLTGLKMLRGINSFIDKERAPQGFGLGKIIWNALVKHDYRALGKFHERALFIGTMHFMDKFNYDIER